MAAALYNMALRQASSIQSDLTRLESEHPTSSTSVALQGQIAASLSSFTRTVEDYESMSKREVNEVKREKALGRVKKFREDEKEVRANLKRIKERDPSAWTGGNTNVNGGGASASSSSLQNGPYGAYGSSSARATSAAHLESPFSLHARNNTSAANAYGTPIQQQQQNDPLAAYKMNASAQAMFGGGGGGDGYSAREGHALREHSFIQNTEQQLDAFIAQGREVWGNLTEQRDILKGTQRRLLDAANTMGLSRNVINAIERRSTQDNIIFAVGVVFTLVCFCEWKIFRRRLRLLQGTDTSAHLP
jgi:Golgi SNAP receptor complex protein 2